MRLEGINRIIFHSREDMSVPFYLQDIESLLNNIEMNDNFKVNDFLEFYHIKLYFDNDFFLLSWNDKIKKEFQTKVNQLWDITKQFFLTIDNTNISSYVADIEFSYQGAFWKIIEDLEIFKKIDKPTFILILNENKIQIRQILLCEKIVRYFGSEVRLFLLSYEETAELLLSQIEDKRIFKTPPFSFPKCLSKEDKENIILKYIDSTEANLNYIRLIQNSRDLNLSSKTKLNAKRRASEITQELFKENSGIPIKVEVGIADKQIEPLINNSEGTSFSVVYGKLYLDRMSNNIELLDVFASLFDFVDKYGLITLVSKENELILFERIGLNSKYAYLTGVSFSHKNMASYAQTVMFEAYLNKRDSSIEKLLYSFITAVSSSLKVNFRLNLASESSSYLERIRTLAPELEYLLKQYNHYVNENEIDFDLLEFDSIPIRFSEILSLVDKKYLYAKGETIQRLKYCFFSDQSSLFYIEPFKNKYNNLYSLLTNEDVRLSNFKEYQLRTINKLIEEGYLYIDNDSFLRIQNKIMISLIGRLYKDEALSYWHYEKQIRLVIDRMEEDGLVYFENTLFTQQETAYFNFFLNKKEFTNGKDLRNKYMHGTNSASTEQHQRDYYVLLRTMILVLLKIRDDIGVKVLSHYL